MHESQLRKPEDGILEQCGACELVLHSPLKLALIESPASPAQPQHSSAEIVTYLIPKSNLQAALFLRAGTIVFQGVQAVLGRQCMLFAVGWARSSKTSTTEHAKKSKLL